MILASKKEMYPLYEAGRFGNRLQSWPTVSAFQQSGYDKLVVLRYKGKGGQWCKYGVEPNDVPNVVAQWASEGADSSLVCVNEMAEDHLILLQGEVMRSLDFIYLRYTTVPKPMRVALKEGECHARGLAAVKLLRDTMDPQSYDEMWQLLDDFDGAVIEFSVWSKDVGDCPRRNTVFWEVRHY